ncbi:MAG: hypothetical protein KKH94_04865 [Candidatus Omnitrophica bacterium]|nr:hypothetical protein [Candidatus Omnitrophota bacterium]
MVKLDKNKFGLLIASFILSVSLFYYISGEESVEIEKRVFLRIIPSKGITILGGPRREIKVTLSAPRNMLSSLSTHKLIAQHRIREVKNAGEYSFGVRESDINLPHGGVKVVDIKPKVITVSLDEVVTKKLLVKAHIVGEPAASYTVDYDNILKDPTAALVKGPKSRLEKKKFILTDSIDVVGRIRSFRIRVPLKYSSQYSVVSKESIDVYIPLKQEGFQKVVENIPVHVLYSASSDFFVTINPTVITVPLKGPEKILAKLGKDDLLAYIDITSLSRGEYQLPLMMNLPPEVSLAQEVPIINVNIEEKIKELIPSITPELTTKENQT